MSVKISSRDLLKLAQLSEYLKGYSKSELQSGKGIQKGKIDENALVEAGGLIDDTNLNPDDVLQLIYNQIDLNSNSDITLDELAQFSDVIKASGLSTDKVLTYLNEYKKENSPADTSTKTNTTSAANNVSNLSAQDETEFRVIVSKLKKYFNIGSFSTTSTSSSNRINGINYAGNISNVSNTSGVTSSTFSGYNAQRGQALANAATSLYGNVHKGNSRCATGVSQAIQKAFGYKTYGNGCDYGNVLSQRSDWKEITNQVRTVDDLKKLPAGAIVSWSAYNTTSLGRLYGHVYITDGKGHGISDFTENISSYYLDRNSKPRVFIPI